MSQTSVHGVFYPDLSQAYNMVRVIDAPGEGGGGGVLPYMGYIGTCRGIGYSF